MKLLSKLIKNRRLLIVVGIIILIFLILFAGKMFGLSSNTRLIGIVIVLFLWVMMLMFERNKANRGAELLEQSIKAQANQQIMGLRPAKREEIEQLQQQLIASIEALKKSKLGKGRSGKSALYALPWYIFIGPPASGKTTAIENSGLEFPYGSEKIRGVGGTRNCDWFFSNQAILLDTAGRYMTEEEDKEEWLAFLEILKKHRKRQPINGVIIGVSIADLANANWDEIERHANNIRRRIDELIEKLGIRFPVYLVFTKCDLLQGHVEFFEELNRAEREQIWGCTLTREQQHDLNPAAVLESEFDELSQSLNNFRFSRLSSPTKREIRHKIFNYPPGFRSMREKLSQFVGKLFQSNPYKESPLFRGFYFTSGTQEGVPIDRVIQNIAKEFDLPPEMIAPFNPEMETKSYFIKDLFTDVIIPDQYLVSETSRAATQKRFLRIGIGAAAVVVLGLFILGVSSGFVRSKRDLNKVYDSAKVIQQVDWQHGNALDYFQRMERVRDQIDQIENQTATILQFGMSRGNRVLEPARRLYYKKSQEFIQRYIYDELERRLRNITVINNDKGYDYLKAYLLMGDEKTRLVEDENLKKFLNKECNTILNDSFYRLINAPNVDDLRILVERQINFYIDLIAQKDNIFKLENNKRLVERARLAISRNPTIESVYSSLKNDAEDKLAFYTITQALGGSPSPILSCDEKVPGFLTKQGWSSHVENAIEEASKNPTKEDWVLGDRRITLPPNMKNPDLMKQELQRLYYDDYVKTWRKFLQSIKYEPFETISEASIRLKLIADFADSPLNKLINNVTQETKFESKIASTAAGAPVLGQYVSTGHPIDRNFAALHELIDDQKRNTILGQYMVLSDVLAGMESDPGVKTRDYAAKILETNAGEIPTALRDIQRALTIFDPISRKAIFEQPIHQAWATILIEAQKYLNNQWRQRVYEPFKTAMANNYPFNPSGQDARIRDFDQFFLQQTGTLWSFFEDELKPFVKKNTWQSNLWEGRGIQISSSMNAALRKADEINKMLFQGGSLMASFSLTPALPERIGIKGTAPIVEQIYLNIDGVDNYYQMGGQYPMDYSWPGRQGSPGARLEVFVAGGNNPEAKRFSGEWGWIRLLQQATFQRQTAARYQIKWLFSYKDQYQIWVKYDLQATSAYNPFGSIKNLFNFHCPETLN